ncbi:MAG: hypothetical protein R2724_06620 [Bryobacterales bacterium]
MHDIVRQYDASGALVRSLLPRLSFSSSRHPASEAALVASPNSVAIVSPVADQWVVLSDQGNVVSRGSMRLPTGARLLNAALTDSGRLLVGLMQKEAGSQTFPLLELDTNKGQVENVAMSAVAPAGQSVAWLLGADHEQLVFQVVEARRGGGSS